MFLYCTSISFLNFTILHVRLIRVLLKISQSVSQYLACTDFRVEFNHLCCHQTCFHYHDNDVIISHICVDLMHPDVLIRYIKQQTLVFLHEDCNFPSGTYTLLFLFLTLCAYYILRVLYLYSKINLFIAFMLHHSSYRRAVHI